MISIIGCQKKYEILKRDGKTKTMKVSNSDNAMNLAITKAQETLPEFKKALESNNPNYSNFALKQRFDDSDGGGEHIWIGEIEMRNGKYFGFVVNDPVSITQIKLGDSVEVVLDKISDWMYYDKNFVKGAFTVRVMRSNMSEAELKEMDTEGIIYE